MKQIEVNCQWNLICQGEGIMQKIILFLPCIFLNIVLPTQQVNAEENNVYFSNVWLNGIDKNLETLIFEEDKKIYIECQALKTLELKGDFFPKHAIKQEFCLISLNPVVAEIDPHVQSVKITVPAEYFQVKKIDQEQLIMPNKAALGAFLNYDLFYGQTSQDENFNSLAELGVFKDYWMFQNSILVRGLDNKEDETALALEDVKEEKVVRLRSSFDLDFPDKFLTLTLGDTTTISNPFVNSVRYGGLSFGTNFTDRPDYIYWNMPTLKGSAVLPSIVDLYINGVSISQQRVNPGNYTLQPGALIQQSGDAQVVVEDILGNKTVQNFPVYINNKLLKPQLNEYNISLGKIRYNYDLQNDDYREFFSNIYFRRGVGNLTTLGLNAAYSEEVKNLGLLWTQAISKYALLDTFIAGSDNKDGSGYSIGGSISRAINNIYLGFSGQYSTDDYKTLGYSNDVFIPKYDYIFYFSIYDLPIINNFNLNYLERVYYEGDDFNISDSRILNIGISRMLLPNLSFSISAFKEFAGEQDSGAYLSLNYSLGNNKNAYFSHSTDNETRVQFVKASPAQTGFDYVLGATQRRGSLAYQASGLLKSNVGDLRVQLDQSDEYENNQVIYRGAVVWLGGKVALTKSVDNAFALVKVEGSPEIDVTRSLSPVGSTNKNGYLFVHNIIPYVPYDISFDQNQLAIEDAFDYSSQKMIGLNQRGYILDFPVYHTQQVILRLLDKNNQLMPRAGEVYINDDESQYFPIDAQGRVYLYGLKPDKYRFLAKTKGGEVCQGAFEVSNQNQKVVEQSIIDVICR